MKFTRKKLASYIISNTVNPSRVFALATANVSIQFQKTYLCTWNTEFLISFDQQKLWVLCSIVQDWQSSCQGPSPVSNHDGPDKKVQSFRQFASKQQIREPFLAATTLTGAGKEPEYLKGFKSEGKRQNYSPFLNYTRNLMKRRLFLENGIFCLSFKQCN